MEEYVEELDKLRTLICHEHAEKNVHLLVQSLPDRTHQNLALWSDNLRYEGRSFSHGAEGSLEIRAAGDADLIRRALNEIHWRFAVPRQIVEPVVGDESSRIGRYVTYDP